MLCSKSLTSFTFVFSGYYVLLLIVFDAFTIYCAAIIINLHYFGMILEAPPPWLLSLTMKMRIPLLLCEKVPHPKSIKEESNLSKRFKKTLTRLSTEQEVTQTELENQLVLMWAELDEIQYTNAFLDREWHFIALIWDRFFFFVNVVIFIFFLILYNSYSTIDIEGKFPLPGNLLTSK